MTFRFLILAAVVAVPVLAKSPEWAQARQLVDQSKFKQAVELLQKAPASKDDSDNLQLLGEALIELKDWGKAVDALESASKLAPNSSHVWLWLGRAWGRRAEHASWWQQEMRPIWAGRCRDAFEKAVDLDPKNIDALDDLFEYYMGAPGFLGGGLAKAEAVARKVLALDKPKGERLLAQVDKERQK